ncbi:MAG: glycosyltransferase family 2 protein [Bryocella sp.]
MSAASVPVSVLILTKDEAKDLPGCLDSVAFSDDVHVLDSGSTDATCEIAAASGAQVHVRAFDDYAGQRNAGMQLPFRHEWVLVLDADERATEVLASEIAATLATVSETAGAFRIRRRDFLWGTWLKHAQMSPFYVRLVRVGRVHYTRSVNEVGEVSGETLELREPFDHFPFSKGISHWIDRHNLYSTCEAEVLATGGFLRDASWKQALCGKDFHTRRVAQKALFYKMPGRPAVKWVYLMFVRGAVLDGAAGWMYSTLQAIYEYFIEVKCREITRRR